MLPDAASSPPQPWWETRRYALLLVVLAAVPLLWPPVPPLTDLLGHIGRYRVELDLATSPFLSRWYAFDWRLMGNLGVDLLVIPLAWLIGLEPAVKLIVLAIPPMTVAGLLLIAREVHGRLPATAAFAAPLAWCWPFQFGFVNFALAMAFGLLAFGLWLRLRRLGRRRLRAGLFVPIGALIWLAHSYGWGVLGLSVFAAELVLARRRGVSWWRCPIEAGIACLPLAPPALLMLAWRSENVAGQTRDWFNWTAKKYWIEMILRERRPDIDKLSVILLFTLVAAGLVRIRLRIDLLLGTVALVLAGVFVAMPRIALGSAYADMRLAPYVLAFALIALVPHRLGRGGAGALALAALAFLLFRTAGTTATLIEKDAGYHAQLAAIDHIPRGARVFTLVHLRCEGQWDQTRMDHLGSLAIARRDAFVNGQWTMAGAQLLTVRYPQAGDFATDPSQQLRPARCKPRLLRTFEQNMARFPRAAFDYVWLIDKPWGRLPAYPGLTPVWKSPTGSGILYRIGSATAASDTPKGNDPPATK